MLLRRLSLVLVAGLVLLVSVPSEAQEAFPLMDMPASYTDVIDAFDGADVLDVNVRAGFVRSSRSGTIQREMTPAQIPGGPPRPTTMVDVAEHSRVVNSLRLGLDVGIYKDLALFAALPLVLRDSRELSLAAGRSAAEIASLLEEIANDGSGVPLPDQETALFSVPFKAPPRSGIPAIHLGIAWSPTNQSRTPDLPTWLLLLETRLATGAVIRACNPANETPAAKAACSSPGVSDGISAIRLESRTSYRYRHLEPYVGLALELQWVSTGGALFGNSFEGLVHRQPPRTGEVTIGTALIPWEDRERFQRVAFDLRASGAYVSEGRDITPLFDALGSSGNPFLAADNYDRVDPDASQRRVAKMTGVTDTTPHAQVAFQAAAEIQAAKYIRFVVGLGAGYAMPYLLTGTDACNPSVKLTEGDTRQGGCSRGILNPAHRPVIDATGQRFRLNGEVSFDLFASATAQF